MYTKKKLSQKIKILNREISDNIPPLVIAEVSANHNNSIKNTLKLIEQAAKIGVEAIKFQTFNLDDMTLNLSKKEFLIKNNFKNKDWNRRSLYNLYKEAQFPFEWHHEAFQKAKSLGMLCFSSVFDEKSIDFLEKLNVPAYKVASLECLHFPLIKKLCETKKPLIISTGTLNLTEIDELINFLKKNKCKKFVILHCVTQYPTEPKNVNLKTISYLKKKYKCLVGFSDHTSGIGSSINSVGFGSNIIEKHFHIPSKSKSLDHQFSLDPTEMKIMIKEVNNAWYSIGRIKTKLSNSEIFYKRYRRSIYASKDIKKNTKFNQQNIKIIRPGLGLMPKYYNKIIGTVAVRNIKKGQPISKKMLKTNQF
jgi:N-acetylneuraminate synthase